MRGCPQSGPTQSDIARRLSISQPEVHRILHKVENFPDLLSRTPREVILDFHAQRITHDSMMEQLSTWPYTFPADAEPDNPLGAVAGGSWDEITDAAHRDLIHMDDFKAIVLAVRPATA